MASIRNLSIETLRLLYGTAEATPLDVITHVYDRIESEPLHPVWIELIPRAQALARAQELQGSHPGPLYGIPFAVKDNIDVAGLPTTAGCPEFAYHPQSTAFVVQRLLNAGAILIGKTNLDQFATGLVGVRSPHGPCSSVFNKSYISGGSSSGSAVAVASGLVSFSLGTDTAGSGRVPAAFNNIIGLKPTRGILSTAGVVPACRSLDCVSILALTAADAAAIFDVAKAFDPQDAFSREWPAISQPSSLTLRIGVPTVLEFFGDVHAEQVYRDTIATLAKEGATIVPVDVSPFLEAAQLLYGGPYVAERFAAVGLFAKTHPAAMNPTVGSIITASEHYTAAQAFEATYKLRALSRATATYWNRIDTLLLPTAPTTYTIADVLNDPIKLNANLGYYTNFVNLLDLSAVAVPAGFTPNGLPFGVTVIAPAYSDYRLLQLASTIQHHRVTFSGLKLKNMAESVGYVAPALQAGWVKIAVVGAHLSGQPLNHQLTSRGAKLLRTTRTASDYKLFALTDASPLKPALIRTPGFAGQGIEVEVWLIPDQALGGFVTLVPPPLAIGTCALADGENVKGFVCEPYGVTGMPDITKYGSWRNYLAAR